MVRASDRGLLAALGALFLLLVGAIFVLAPGSESAEAPWIVGDVEPVLPDGPAGTVGDPPPPF